MTHWTTLSLVSSSIFALSISLGGCGNRSDDTPPPPLSDAGMTGDGATTPDSSMPPECIDLDGDGYGDACPMGPDCDDGDNAVHPGIPDRCDGVDNDCDTATADGSAETRFGQECDGDDADLCREGAWSCDGVALYCADMTGDAEELCNDIDDDCDTVIDEGGTGCCTPGTMRDCGSDVGECSPGTQSCDTEGTWSGCAGAIGPMPEGCDGLDNDCDPATTDGVDEPTLGNTCDGMDSDECEEGLLECLGGGLACSDASGDDLERCDGADNDCDMATDEGTDGDCTVPPAASCSGAMTLQTWDAAGMCSMGGCEYISTDVACPISCEPGAGGAPARCIECVDGGDCASFESCMAGVCVSSCTVGSGGAVTIDVPAVDATFVVQLNGVMPPDLNVASGTADSLTEIPQLVLTRDGVTHASFPVYNPQSAAGTLTAQTRQMRLLSGTYDVVYQAPSDFDTVNNLGLDQWPRNTAATIVTTLDLSASGTFTIDVEAVDVTFVTTLNGATPPSLMVASGTADSSTEIPQVTLRRDGRNQASYLTYQPQSAAGTLAPQNRSFRLIPGDYDASYNAPSDFDTVNNVNLDQWPRNLVSTPLRTLSITTGGTMTVDVGAVDVTFTTTLNGTTPPSLVVASGTADSSTEIPQIAFRQSGLTHASYLVYQPQSAAGTLAPQIRQFRLIPGSYDAAYDAPSDFDTVNNVNLDQWPRNQASTILRTVNLTSSGGVTINIAAVDVSFATTLNGATPPSLTVASGTADSATEIPRIALHRDGRTQATYLVYQPQSAAGILAPQVRDFRLIPGSYDVSYLAPSDFDTVNNVNLDQWPRNIASTTLRTLTFTMGGAVTIDVGAVDIVFTTTLNGATPPSLTVASGTADSATEIPQIVFRQDEVTHASYLVYQPQSAAGALAPQTRSFRLIPGDYDAAYVAPSDFDTVNNINLDQWPRNGASTILRTLSLVASAGVTVDVGAVDVMFITTLNAMTPPDLMVASGTADSSTEIPQIFFTRDGRTQASYLIYQPQSAAGTLAPQIRSFRLIPGVYDASYSAPSDFDTVNNVNLDQWPRNLASDVLDCVVVL